MDKLVWIGKIVDIQPIPNADRIDSCTVVCGEGGEWVGIVKKNEFNAGDQCQIYLQDSLLPQIPEFEFMKASNYRVKICRFRGALSECLITKQTLPGKVGDDVTKDSRVEKYNKPISEQIAGEIKGNFPSFIPKTDELNFQCSSDIVRSLQGNPYYITIKYDGTSTTVFVKDGIFGVCSRNLELKKSKNNLLWKMVEKYRIEETMPMLCQSNGNFALQWETVGPGVQKNPLKLPENEIRLFDVFFIDQRRYAIYSELENISSELQIPMVQVIDKGNCYCYEKDDLSKLVENNKMPNSNIDIEGIVVRPTNEMKATTRGNRVSFKFLNPLYKH